MEFVFNTQKLKDNGYTEEQCLNVIRKHFKKYDTDNSIIETHTGFFEGSDEQDDFDAFSTSAIFPYTKWFLKVIKEWYFYSDEGYGEEKEDCLESHYKVNARNSKRNTE